MGSSRIKIDFIGYLKLREDFYNNDTKNIYLILDGFLQSVLGFILL